MVRQTIEHDGVRYSIAIDDFVADACRSQVVVKARLVDEITGDGLRRGVRVLSNDVQLLPCVGPDALIGLTAVPLEVFPNLDASSYVIEFSLAADGYIRESRAETIAAQAGFPESFAPLDLGTIRLHAEPVRISGYVMVDTGARRTPQANVPVWITDFWRTLPPPGGPDNIEPASMVSLSPPLYASRTTATGQFRPRGLTLAGTPKRLTVSAFAGDTEVRLTDQKNLTPGDVLAIEFADAALPAHDPAKTEYVSIESVQGGATPDHTATATLVHPLAFTHRAGVVARRADPQPPGASRSLSRRAIAGEQCVFLANLAGLGGAATVEVLGGLDPDGNPIPPEYHNLALFDTVTGGDGYYRFPPLSRVAQIRLETTVEPATPFRLFNPDYTRSTNRCDIVHSP